MGSECRCEYEDPEFNVLLALSAGALCPGTARIVWASRVQMLLVQAHVRASALRAAYKAQADNSPTTLVQTGEEEDEGKKARREIEAAIQAMYAARNVRRVDQLGRAYGTGKRKCSIARVWIKQARTA